MAVFEDIHWFVNIMDGLSSQKENLEFTINMVKDVEFYVTKMNCSPQQICKALEEKYLVKIYMPVLHWALTDDETKEAHTWILQQIKKVTFEATPYVIFTDADPTLIVAIRDKFPTTHALNYQKINIQLQYDIVRVSRKLSVCILKEDKKTVYALFHASIPKTALTATAETPTKCLIALDRKDPCTFIAKYGS
ncbi:37686_t:CDS:2 [Gigaspora margarita]|uniref:37686_t:CDS:1 n=1 Tax=Gigaspora margarita TaxID=4874 RepID=A0ABN7UJJ1_GIGMA|nr:37686_t:CDS:2 [Gigaspora margarita]